MESKELISQQKREYARKYYKEHKDYFKQKREEYEGAFTYLYMDEYFNKIYVGATKNKWRWQRGHLTGSSHLSMELQDWKSMGVKYIYAYDFSEYTEDKERAIKLAYSLEYNIYKEYQPIINFEHNNFGRSYRSKDIKREELLDNFDKINWKVYEVVYKDDDFELIEVDR